LTVQHRKSGGSKTNCQEYLDVRGRPESLHSKFMVGRRFDYRSKDLVRLEDPLTPKPNTDGAEGPTRPGQSRSIFAVAATSLAGFTEVHRPKDFGFRPLSRRSKL
jgi:hypothetical protein